MRIFLSYRRADVGGHAGRLSDTLVQRLGAKNVFQDVTDIAAGRDFVASIREALDGCDAAVAVIGPGWLAAATPEGRPRLFEPDDYVRLELATVLARDLPVAPVLVGGAALPAAADLPEDLRPLVQRQAIAVRDESWHHDVDHLVRSLRGQSAAPTAPAARRRVGLAAGAAVAAVLIALVLWRPWAGGSDDAGSDTAAPTGCPDPSGPEWTPLVLAANPTVESDADGGPNLFTVRAGGWRPVDAGHWEVVVKVSLENRKVDEARHDYYRYDALVVGGRPFEQTCFDAAPELVDPGLVSDGRTGYIVTCDPEGRIELRLDNGAARLPVTAAPDPTRC